MWAMTSPRRLKRTSRSKAPSSTALADRLGHLLDQLYPRLTGPETLFAMWLPMQMMIVRDRIGRCKQRWDKTLPISSVVTSPVLAEQLSLDLPLAKSYGQIVFPDQATETCLDRLCQLVVLQALFTATGNPDMVTVQVTVNEQPVNLTEAVGLPT
jgi:hypothetical protein